MMRVHGMIRVLIIALITYAVVALVIFLRQRSLLYFPTHREARSTLLPWRVAGKTIGYCREVPNPRTVWLMMHGNAGQAADRDYVLPRISPQDSLYVLEYPGYGSRQGSPCLTAMNLAAAEAYRVLRSSNPGTAVALIGESVGSGPACALASEQVPPEKIVLVVPFDTLAHVASHKFPFLPIRLLLRDHWDNVQALTGYRGALDIYGAVDDQIIPITHAKVLADSVPGARFIPIAGGHNDWPENAQMRIER